MSRGSAGCTSCISLFKAFCHHQHLLRPQTTTTTTTSSSSSIPIRAFLKQTAPSGGRSDAGADRVELQHKDFVPTCPATSCLSGSEEDMGIEERLNDRQYMNWLKAGQCLLLLKDALHPFITQHMKAFHGDLLNRNTLLRKPCVASCKPKGTKLSSLCQACSVWQAVILEHHRQQETATVNWGNCYPPNWRTDYWELAKAYMPRGQSAVKEARYCDASALLNLINYCDWFQFVDLKCVREMIRYRNELMHSCECRVKDEWMKRYQTTLSNLVRQFSHVPQMATVSLQIKEMLTIDLAIYVSGLDRMDSADLGGVECDSLSQLEISADLISQWEAELLQESLHELLHAVGDDDDDTKTQDAEHLKRLGGFLQANKDLAERFSSELQAINSVETRE